MLFCVFVFGIGYYFLGFYTFSGIDYSQSVLIEARVESITNYTNFSTCILDDLKITSPIIKVYNKCDKLESKEQTDGLYISAKNNIGIDDLKNAILEKMSTM